MRARECVGALVRDGEQRVYAQRRTANRRVLPGIWDIIGGHVEPGESMERALAREIEEETGWRLRHIEAVVADWEWEHDGVVRRELDYLVEVDGDLNAPRLEETEHDAHAWVGPDTIELMMEGRTDGDRRLRDIVAKATRTRLTERLRLEPIGPEHAHDLYLLHEHDAVSEWHGGRWSRETAKRNATQKGEAWEAEGVEKWVAYDRGTGRHVGRGGLSRMPTDSPITRKIAGLLPVGHWSDHRLEVGWTVHPDLWGQGFATEIGRAGIQFAFDDLGAPEVVAFTETHNARSRAVMERLTMRFVGEFVGPDDAAFCVYHMSSAKPLS